ncbi:hypothetical protein C1646_662983 [Rhizophagus diaphanus]|nr:hypothetical protein C1646_662983 [Rhizophagus diaphanus] [Rhizophagus sp. MUCL 43196]
MEFEIKITRGLLDEAKKRKIEKNVKLTVKFVEENGQQLEKWDFSTEIKEILINGQKYENFIEENPEVGNEIVKETENVSEVRNENDVMEMDGKDNVEINLESDNKEEMSEMIIGPDFDIYNPSVNQMMVDLGLDIYQKNYKH